MAEFACRVGAADGRIGQRFVTAESASSARTRLEEDGFEVFAVRRRGGLAQWLREAMPAAATANGSSPATTATADPAAAEASSRSMRWSLFGGRGIAAADVLLLAEELAALIRAGLPLLRCLDILRRRRAGNASGAVLDRVRERVAGGESLSHAFELEDPSARVPRLFVTSLAIGESGGELEGALRRYAKHLERAQTLRRRVRGALMYPAALFGVSFIVLGILMGFVLPRFADFYASYGAQLPMLTRVLLVTAGFLQGHWTELVVGLVLLVAALAIAARSEGGLRLRDRWSLRLPLVGRLRRLYLDVESSRTLATLLEGGAPLLEALRVAAAGTDNRTYRRSLHQVGELVSQGNSLHNSLEATGLMDSLGLEMVEVGESTGSLETMLTHVADSYDEILERRLNTAVGLLEPAVLVSMGVFVATVLLSLYMPLFQTAQVVR